MVILVEAKEQERPSDLDVENYCWRDSVVKPYNTRRNGHNI